MAAYYNEIDPFAAQWLCNLIAAGHIADGEVDERSIVEVQPDDLRGFTQCHFFAGVGVWSHALRSAGWDDARPVWTASLPCQPFSAAGKRLGASDERNLAEVWLRLAQECGPSVCFGEQVEPAIGLNWLDAIFIRLEQSDYACGAAVFPAASVGAPHIRSRIYWVAHAEESRRKARRGHGLRDGTSDYGTPAIAHGRGAGELVNSPSGGCGERGYAAYPRRSGHADGAVEPCVMGNAVEPGPQGLLRSDDMELHRGARADGSTAASGVPGATSGFWRDAEWIACRDGKARPTEPGVAPLVNGASARVGRLRAYGNAICAPQAAQFIRAFCEVMP